MRLHYTPRARADRIAILEYIAPRSRLGAAAVLDAIDETCALISEHPQIGARTRRRTILALPVARYPYRIFYTVSGGVVSITHIRHAARRPWAG